MDSLKKIFWRITKGFLLFCLGIFVVAGAGAYMVTSTSFKDRYDVMLKQLAEQEHLAKDNSPSLDDVKKSATMN